MFFFFSSWYVIFTCDANILYDISRCVMQKSWEELVP